MKPIKTLMAAAVLSTLPFASQAAQNMISTPSDGQKAEIISATGSTSLSPLENQLTAKAGTTHIRFYRIASTAANSLHGTAAVYN